VSADEWLRRWESQQQHGSAAREERFTALVAAIAALCPPAPVILDLGCGPGSVADRVLRRIPQAKVCGVDADPVLLQLGRETHAAEPRVVFIDADINRPDWVRRLPDSSYHAVTSTTALHWLPTAALAPLYRQVFELLQPGGVFLNGDVLPFAEPTLAAAAVAVKESRRQAGPEAETWSQWWDAILVEPAYRQAAAERRRRGHDHPEHAHVGVDVHLAALRAAGFDEVGTLWQLGDNRLLTAIRSTSTVPSR
jgi:SAM-dependent methyltransferase